MEILAELLAKNFRSKSYEVNWGKWANIFGKEGSFFGELLTQEDFWLQNFPEVLPVSRSNLGLILSQRIRKKLKLLLKNFFETLDKNLECGTGEVKFLETTADPQVEKLAPYLHNKAGKPCSKTEPSITKFLQESLKLKAGQGRLLELGCPAIKTM